MRKEEKNPKKISDFLKAHISGTAGVIYFRFVVCSLPICWHLHSKFGLVWSRDHGAIRTRVKSYFGLGVIILTLCAHAPFSWPHDLAHDSILYNMYKQTPTYVIELCPNQHVDDQIQSFHHNTITSMPVK